MNPDGSSARRVPLSGPPHAELFDLDWAPTGDRLISSLAGDIRRLSISDTLGRETFVTAPNSPAHSPAWRPQGDWIAYAKTPPGEFGDLWLIRPDGTGDRLLVRNANFPTWSPDGRRVAFSYLRSGHVAIWAIDIDGSNLQQLTDPSE
jgi:TolB protein